MAKVETVSNVDIVVYTLGLLGGAQRTIHSEHVAAKCMELAPDRFAWRLSEYRERGWPDKFVVKSALENAKKTENGCLVEGIYGGDLSKDGWRLTKAGGEWFRKNADALGKVLTSTDPSRVAHKKDAARFVKRFRSEDVFKRFSDTGDLPSIYAFADLLNCSPDAPPEVVRAKFQRVAAMAELVDDPEIIAFVSACGSHFSALLDNQTRKSGEA